MTAMPAAQMVGKGKVCISGTCAVPIAVGRWAAAPFPDGTASTWMRLVSTASWRATVVCGIRLTGLSMENGSTSRTATTAQRRQMTRLGAFFRRKRRKIAARISQLAPMAVLTSPAKNAVMTLPPHCRSSAEPIPAPHPSAGGFWKRQPGTPEMNHERCSAQTARSAWNKTVPWK